jgi:hypothetical protein
MPAITRALRAWIERVGIELASLQLANLVSPELVDKYTKGTFQFIQQQYNTWTRAAEEDENYNSPILIVIGELPEDNGPNADIIRQHLDQNVPPLALPFQFLNDIEEDNIDNQQPGQVDPGQQDQPQPDPAGEVDNPEDQFDNPDMADDQPQADNPNAGDGPADQAPDQIAPGQDGNLVDAPVVDGMGIARRADGQRNLKVSELLPAPFNAHPNENAVNHFERYRDYVALHGLTDQQAIQRFRLTLSGLPRRWIKNREFPSLDELEKAFVSQYSPFKSREAVIRALSQIKYTPGTSMDKYLSDIRELADRVGHTDEQIRDVFLNGMPDALRAGLLLHSFEGLEDLVDKAQKFLELNPQAAPKQVSFMNQVQEPAGEPANMTALAMAIEEMKVELADVKNKGKTTDNAHSKHDTDHADDRRKSSYGRQGRSPDRYRDSRGRGGFRSFSNPTHRRQVSFSPNRNYRFYGRNNSQNYQGYYRNNQSPSYNYRSDAQRGNFRGHTGQRNFANQRNPSVNRRWHSPNSQRSDYRNTWRGFSGGEIRNNRQVFTRNRPNENNARPQQNAGQPF